MEILTRRWQPLPYRGLKYRDCPTCAERLTHLGDYTIWVDLSGTERIGVARGYDHVRDA